MELALIGLAGVLVLMAIAWVVSLVCDDVSIVDIFWGPAVAGTGAVYVLADDGHGPRGTLVVGLALLWALRLAFFVAIRTQGHPEDRRYQEIRQRNQPNFPLKSLYLIFGLQGVLAWLIAMPLLGAVVGPNPFGVLDVLGVVMFAAGLLIETVADWQMLAFRHRPGSEKRVMDQGLWRYSRHPNYFGEATLWWGLAIVAAGAGAWWTVVSPLLLTFLLLKFSGVALTEKDIADRRPEYRDYIRRTSAFVPLPRRR